MRKETDILWTWLFPDTERKIDRQEWIKHGGKWIIFDKKNSILALAERLGPFIDSRKIESAKYWNKDPSAICVYCLETDREITRQILEDLGAGKDRVWEYDYAWDKNILKPGTFIHSWCSKFRTILQSYGIPGTLRLMKELLKPR